MVKTKVIYIMGVSGSGKSTVGKLLAEELGVPFFDGDDFHPKANLEKMALGQALNDTDRAGWLQSLNMLAKEYNNTGAVIACSALKKHYRSTLMQGVAEHSFVYLEGTFDVIQKRLQARKGHFMPPHLLQSQFDALEPPTDAISVSILNPQETIVTHILNQLP